jgi:hypothetical protein
MADEATERITILLQARDADMKRALDRNTQAIRRYEREATKATTAAARNIEQNMAKSNAAFAGMAKAGVAAVGVLVASLASGALRNAIGQVADLADSASRIGVGTDALQGLQRGFQLAGVDAASLSSSLEMFTQRVGEAADGAGPLAEILRANSISIRDQNGEIRPTLSLLNDFADVINKTTSQAEKMALLNDAFGRSGRAMVDAFEGGSVALQQMITDAVEGGYALDEEMIQRAAELDDKFDDLTLKAGNFFKAFAVGVGESALGLKMMAEDLAALAVDSVTPEPITVDEQAMTALRQIGADAEALAGYLDRTANDLRRIGVEGYENLNTAASEMRRLNEGLIDGTISGAEFDSQMRTASETALGLMLSLEDVDQQQFGNVIASLGGLINGLVTAANAAAATRAEIARMSAAGSTSLPALSGPAGMGAPPAGPSIPAEYTGPEIVARPLDIDFGYTPPATTGGGRTSGGGGTPSPAEPAYWDDLVQSVQDAQDALEEYNEVADAGADKMADLFLAATEGADAAKEALAQLLLELAKVAAQSAFTSMAGAGSPLQPIFSAIGAAFGGPSFAGGGYTGTGSRSGGVDGQGGFPAILHPNETVIDHSRGGGGGGSVEIIVRSEPGTIVEIARNTANAAIREASPMIENRAVAKTGRAMGSTRTFGSPF